MKYSWEVLKKSRLTGLFGPMSPRRADHEEADSAQEVADRYASQLLPGQRLNVWDVVGVGKSPVLTVDA